MAKLAIKKTNRKTRNEQNIDAIEMNASRFTEEMGLAVFGAHELLGRGNSRVASRRKRLFRRESAYISR